MRISYSGKRPINYSGKIPIRNGKIPVRNDKKPATETRGKYSEVGRLYNYLKLTCTYHLEVTRKIYSSRYRTKVVILCMR